MTILIAGALIKFERGLGLAWRFVLFLRPIGRSGALLAGRAI